MENGKFITSIDERMGEIHWNSSRRCQRISTDGKSEGPTTVKSEIHHALEQLKTNKSPGLDDNINQKY